MTKYQSVFAVVRFNLLKFVLGFMTGWDFDRHSRCYQRGALAPKMTKITQNMQQITEQVENNLNVWKATSTGMRARLAKRLQQTDFLYLGTRR
jgi:hypothetical protein